MANTYNPNVGGTLISQATYTPPDQGAVARTVKDEFDDMTPNARRWGVVPGAADSFAQLQAAIDDVGTSGRGRTLRLPRGTFNVSAELSNPYPVSLIGDGGAATALTTIKLTAPARSVMALTAPGAQVRGVTFDANRRGTHAMYGANHGRARFEEVRWQNAIKDGLFSDRSGNNNACAFDHCWFFFNGTVYASANADVRPIPAGQVVRHGGTVSITAGSPVVTGSGTSFVATGARAGDFVKIGANFYEIAKAASGSFGAGMAGRVDSDTQITLATNAIETLSGAEYGVHVGDGHMQVRYGDNNAHVYTRTQARGNAGSALSLNGQYGSTLIGGVFDTHHCWALKVGSVANGDVVYGTAVVKPYFEGNAAGPIYAAFARDLQVVAPMHNEATPLVAGADYAALSGQRLSANRMAYDFATGWVDEASGELYWTPKTSAGVRDANGVPAGRLILPARGRVSAGTVAAGGSADVAVGLPYNFRRFLSAAQNAAVSVTMTPEAANGLVRAAIVSRTTTDGLLDFTARVYNDHSQAQAVWLNWTAVM